jgi:hypothetical protein
MCGAHRHANKTASACDADYDEADCAHSKDNMYYPTVLEIDSYYGGDAHTQIQWHGMADTTCPDLNIYISHGMSTVPPDQSNVNSLMANVQLHHPTWAVDVPGDGTCPLSATGNTEGRYLNGVAEPDVCAQRATATTNKFVHVEQERAFRYASEWLGPVGDTWPAGGAGDTPPLPPVGVSATPGDAQVTLSWAATAGADSYTVWTSATSGGLYTAVATAVLGTSYIHTDLSNGTTYYYVITAANGFGESAYSTEVSATPEAAPAPTPPPPPGNLSASAARRKINLSWNSVTGATSYQIYRSATDGGPYTAIATVTDAAYRDAGLADKTTYYYVVTASDAQGESAPSNQAWATTK